MVRDRPEWMRPVDERLIEIFRSDEVSTPQQVEDLDICHRNYAATRGRVLVSRGALELVSRGVYQTTELGRRWLNEEASASEFEPVDEST